ncbi:hypothetical protein KYY02_17075 [Streptomyces pimonensis]|uniref:Uncharacterized protein n=1 Tax=Streptomyces pimonensis TaxID=2860288 RepID=A0ABV4J075_9ACTN
MSLDQLSAAINTWVWIDQQITTYGPGIDLYAVIATARAITKRIHRQLRDASHHINELLTPATPADDTQPGTDDDLLADCWDAWKAPEPRKGKP